MKCAANKMVRSIRVGLVVLTTGFLCFLSLVSKYDLKSPYEVNLDIAMMLTPYGLLVNLVGSESALRPYYWHVTTRENIFQHWNILLALILLQAAAWVLYIVFLKE